MTATTNGSSGGTRRKAALPVSSVGGEAMHGRDAVNADAPAVELIEVEDRVTGPLGVKGVGEIGQVSSAAAVANAVYHATGYRPRGLPIAVEHLLPLLPPARSQEHDRTAMTGTAPHRPQPADLLGHGGTPPPGRPLLTTPPHLQRRDRAELQRRHLAGQPWLGLGGLLLAAVVFFALALGAGSTATSLLILGPMSAFALPVVVMVAFWWNDWPGSRLTAPWTGLIDTVLVVATAVVLTIAGQAVVERSDVRGVFEATPGPGVPVTFPATLVLAAAVFTAMLQLLLVCERWPVDGLELRWSGLAALALSWAAGTSAYFLFVNLGSVPAADRAAAGLRDPGGPVAGPDFGSALVAVGVWQTVLFIVLRGWPVNTITRRPLRLLAGNGLVIGLGALTYLVLRNIAHWPPPAIGAACGCVISAALVVGMLFEGWPAARLPSAASRALTLALTALVALALDRVLASYADGVQWIRATPDEWITTATLSYAAAGILLHVGIGLRWPFALKTGLPDESAPRNRQ